MSFSLRLLGGATIEGPEGPLAGRAAQRHRLALLALLAGSPAGTTRDKAVAYLWPETDDERARRLLSDSLYRIHQALGDGVVQAVGDELRLDTERVPSDVWTFEQALAREEWERAAEVYGGPFLDGFHLPGAAEFEHWVERRRAGLAEAYATALEALAGQKAAAGDLAAAVAFWRRRAAHDRYDSRVAMCLMEALAAAGNRAGALRHARVHQQLLEDEFGVDPPPEVTALAERLRAGGTMGDPGPPATGTSKEVDRHAEDEEENPRTGQEDNDPEAGGPDPEAGAEQRLNGRSLFGRRHRTFAATVLAVLALGLGWALRSGPEPAPPHSPGLAVLPFANLSSGEDSLYFADGVTEEVLTSLSRIGDLRVVARASVMPYRDWTGPVSEIASTLGVDYVLQGSVRRSNDDVRIAVQLIDAAENVNIWAEAYERPLEDIFAVQSDIARRVADALQARLTPGVAALIDRAPTDDLEAYNSYLRGRYYWHRRTQADLAESVRFFRAALERDHGYAQAWVGLADAYAVQAFYDYRPPGEVYPEAKRAATRALAIDETLPEAHASLGYITLYYDWDAPAAETSFRRAIELNPSYSVAHQWYANLLVATGRFDEAARAMGRAREVNPLSLIANGALGWVHYYAARFEEAVEQCDLALEMDPDWDLCHLWRGQALEALGRTDSAIESLRRAVLLSGGSGITVAALAHALAGAGAEDEARAVLQGLIDARSQGEYRPSFEIAKVEVALGDHAEALRWLELAYEERSHSMAFLEVDPQLAPLRGDPRFRRLVERVSLEG